MTLLEAALLSMRGAVDIATALLLIALEIGVVLGVQADGI
jgi:hypothetical protein